MGSGIGGSSKRRALAWRGGTGARRREELATPAEDAESGDKAGSHTDIADGEMQKRNGGSCGKVSVRLRSGTCDTIAHEF